MLASPNADQLSEVVAFVVAQQAHPDRNIAYLGADAPQVRAELEGLRPPWALTARVLRNEDGIHGAVIVEWDDELGRAWIHGPWADGDGVAWLGAASALLDAALEQLPRDLTRHELCGDIANRRLGELAAARGWMATEPNHILIVEAEAFAEATSEADGELASHRPARPTDLSAISALHDAEFPDTYASASQLVDDQIDGSRTVLVAEDERGRVIGYIAGELHEDGEGFIDFVAVDPAARGAGVGRQLVVALTRLLVDRSPLGRVALTVQHHRLPARRLYEHLGFRTAGSLIAYRSWTA